MPPRLQKEFRCHPLKTGQALDIARSSAEIDAIHALYTQALLNHMNHVKWLCLLRSVLVTDHPRATSRHHEVTQ